ncbi:hypothetical protein CDAR_576561 [Caerostris darwini]|uniref:Uncharacterized protein n=1 Tax=Caerostris darwini TaxID=1538125 RepID=A0AAV4TL49_9ARAC|nr:hypothetical protein CDAR_576561 [Caerostris darwini]
MLQLWRKPRHALACLSTMPQTCKKPVKIIIRNTPYQLLQIKGKFPGGSYFLAILSLTNSPTREIRNPGCNPTRFRRLSHLLLQEACPFPLKTQVPLSTDN